MKINNRAIAAQIIFGVVDSKRSLSALLPQHTVGINPKDKALIQNISYGVLRHLPLLEQITTENLNTKIKNKNKIVYYLILVGIYQLLYTRIAQHAVLKETVNACSNLKMTQAKGVVNAILRNIIRNNITAPNAINDSITYLHPQWLIDKIKHAYPDNWQEILANNNQQAPMWLRNNQQQQSRTEYLALLQEHNISASAGALHNDILLDKAVKVQELPQFQAGSVSVQDGAAQMAAELLDLKPQQDVLDLCAAPGNKSCHILETQPNLNELVCIDISEDRINLIHENLKRLQLQATVMQADAIAYNPNRQFDRILVDAPCSATGVIRRNPDIKWLRQATDIKQLVEIQELILKNSWKLLKPNGIMLYATCSILPEENQIQIKNFLAQNSNAKIINIQDHNKSYLQILTGASKTDGFFYAKIQKI